MPTDADLIVKSFAGQTNPGDLQLNDRDKALLIRLLANSAFFPEQFKSWLESMIPMFDFKIPMSQVTGAAASAQQAWIAPTLVNSWANQGVPTNNPAGYFKDTLGIVHLRGSLAAGSPVTSVMFVLPAGYRPPYQQNHASVANEAICRITIDASGNVKAASGGSATFTILDGITFRAA